MMNEISLSTLKQKKKMSIFMNNNNNSSFTHFIEQVVCIVLSSYLLKRFSENNNLKLNFNLTITKIFREFQLYKDFQRISIVYLIFSLLNLPTNRFLRHHLIRFATSDYQTLPSLRQRRSFSPDHFFFFVSSVCVQTASYDFF